MLPLFQTFIPHPEISCSPTEFDPAVHKATYRYNYPELFALAGREPKRAQGIFRSLCKNDRFFIAYFVAGWESDKVSGNKPYIVNLCRELEDGADTGTIDVHAREHGKSACITIAGTVQRIVNNAECTTAIFSFRKSSAEKFLESIKHILESDFMKWCFPDICYKNTNETQWSVQNGIRVRRSNQAMKEHTVEAFGLIEGMPTGGHYDHRIYDDIETEDMASSPDQMQTCFEKLMMSRYLGRDGGTEQVIGTYYSHFGTIVKLNAVKDIHGEPLYMLRLKPGTDDGTINGRPVFFSQKYLDGKKVDLRSFNTQILCNPTPQADVKLHFDRFVKIPRHKLPKDRIKIMIIDPAGDKDVQTGVGNDKWAMGCISIKPVSDDLGLSDVYVEDLVCRQMSTSEAQDAGVSMYLRNGRIAMLGIERVSTDSAWLHIKNALASRGRYMDLHKKGKAGGNMMLLSPAGRSKNYKIESNLAWPLNNAKIHLVDDLPDEALSELESETNKFPFFHVDILDMMAYLYDILSDETITYGFSSYIAPQTEEYEPELLCWMAI